jgi:hypothetical protein
MRRKSISLTEPEKTTIQTFPTLRLRHFFAREESIEPTAGLEAKESHI